MYKPLSTRLLALAAWLTAAAPFLPTLVHAEDDLLRPDQAFVISAQSIDNDTVRFNWQIADGYYLYQSKFHFLSDTPGVEFGDPDLPRALPKNDPIFGEVRIYRDEVTIDVPVTAVPGNTEILTLKARSQGCADIGVCYPPHTQTVLVAMNQAADAPPPVDPGAVQEFAPAGNAPPLPDPVSAFDSEPGAQDAP